MASLWAENITYVISESTFYISEIYCKGYKAVMHMLKLRYLLCNRENDKYRKISTISRTILT